MDPIPNTQCPIPAFSASWIGPAYDPKQDLGFFVFWTKFKLEELPNSLEIRVSADPRYELQVNHQLVVRGPQRGDVDHWFFDSIDIAPYLRIGNNIISADVANFGWMAPMAQHSVRTAFLLEAPEPFKFMSTPGEWQVLNHDHSNFAMMNEDVGEFYIDVGPGEIATPVDEASLAVAKAHTIARAEFRGSISGGTPWNLVPRSLPIEPVERFVEPIARFLRRENNVIGPVSEWPELEPGFELIFDFGEIVVGFPTIAFFYDGVDKGFGDIVYCESLVEPTGEKGDRGRIEGKIARGYRDRIEFSERNSSVRPSWIRTFRYIAVTTSVPLKEVLCCAYRSGYPMEITASFESNEPSIPPIWDMCVRTLKLCAGETYYDCPYYEQLQYIGDTRLQALIGYYLSRDRRLQRNAIEQFHWSILENGLTQSRYPSRQMQVIPPFSLWWVVMLYDAWMHDPEFDPNPYITSAIGVLEAYHRILKGEVEPFWCFGDWLPEWKWGVPPGGPAAEMHLVLLEMATWALAQLKGQTHELRRPDRGVQQITEHAESLWRYAQTLAGQIPDPWDEASLQGAPRCTYFWQFVKHVGMRPDDYMAQLGPWREMLNLGLTTTPETPEPTRSDCHGWSAHPPLGLLQIVAGVTSAAPGWNKVRIAPRPGSLERFVATIPHPEGDIVVRYENGDVHVQCPVPFELDWNSD